MRTTTLLLTIAAAAGTLSLSAAKVRVDLSGTKDGVVIQKGESGGFDFNRASWEPKEKQDKMCFLQKAVGADYQEYSFSFIPQKEGAVRISFGGNWSKEIADRPFIIIDDISINGELLPNGDFETREEGKNAPKWTTSGKPVLSTDANSGSSAFRINHDNRITQEVKVEAGKTYTVKFSAKEAK